MAEAIVSKVCTRCKVEKPASAFYVNRALKSGLTSACGACLELHKAAKRAEKRAERLAEKERNKPAGKVCACCKRDLPLASFNRSTQKRGLYPYCKECCKDKARLYRKTESGKAAARRSRQTEAVKLYQWRKRRTEKERERCRLKGQTPQSIEHRKRYYEENKLKCFARSAVSKAVKRRTLPRPDECQCVKCGRPAQEYHHHHGYERARWLDVVAMCRDCHGLADSSPASAATISKLLGG